MESMELLEKKDLREQLINRIDVLNKVKSLFLIPKMKVMTIKQVAEYFEVDSNTLDMCYKRHRNEINPDGTMIKSIREIKGVKLVPIRIE